MARRGTSVLQKDEILSASTEVKASADQVYAVISDITRTPEWSPETVRAEWLTPNRFRAWNRRRLGRWKTDSEVVDAQPGRAFSFVVHAMGGEWTQWTYRIEPVTADSCRLTEEFRMCVAMPLAAWAFEVFFLLVPDRRTDLQANLQASVDRIRSIVETSS
jgi:hypothetical protein